MFFFLAEIETVVLHNIRVVQLLQNPNLSLQVANLVLSLLSVLSSYFDDLESILLLVEPVDASIHLSVRPLANEFPAFVDATESGTLLAFLVSGAGSSAPHSITIGGLSSYQSRSKANSPE